MSCSKAFQVPVVCAFFAFAICCMNACTVSNDSVSAEHSETANTHGLKGGDSSGDKDENDTTGVDSSSSGNVNVDAAFQDYSEYLEFVKIRAMSVSRGSVTYNISSFYIASTEVTQGFYEEIMGSLPDQDKDGEMLPVVNVSWYDAVLFCNALSKKVGLDTVYVYDSVGEKNYLKNLSIDYSVAGIRLPTETEWELAAHGGTDTRFYWDTEVASDYAFYGQSKGPTDVASLIPNAYGLYDMAGNVAEWANDWYDSYSTTDQSNPTGPSTGSMKCLRGGGWADKVADIAPKERDKKDPLYRGVTVGFRIVYSNGF